MPVLRRWIWPGKPGAPIVPTVDHDDDEKNTQASRTRIGRVVGEVAVADRRAEMVQALIELIAAKGIEAATVRRVASRVGVSIGAVQHHFPTKAQMMVAASDELFDRTARRVVDLTVGSNGEKQLRTTASLLIPPGATDELARVWLSLATLSVFDDEAGEVYRRYWQRLRGGLTDLMWQLRPRRTKSSVHAAATALLGMCDGLALSVLSEPQQVQSGQARQIVDNWVTDWLEGRTTFPDST